MLQPGTWRGEGQITFSMADDALFFFTTWTVFPSEEGVIHLSQEIEINGIPEKRRNHFTLRALTPSSFSIELENDVVGKVSGTGVIDARVIAWEFRGEAQEFEGYETYELQEDGSYLMRAEFSAGPEYRTHVRGFITQET